MNELKVLSSIPQSNWEDVEHNQRDVFIGFVNRSYMSVQKISFPNHNGGWTTKWLAVKNVNGRPYAAESIEEIVDYIMESCF